jgi:hypothetical protein
MFLGPAGEPTADSRFIYAPLVGIRHAGGYAGYVKLLMTDQELETIRKIVRHELEEEGDVLRKTLPDIIEAIKDLTDAIRDQTRSIIDEIREDE